MWNCAAWSRLFIYKGNDQAIFIVRQQGNAMIDPKDEVQMFRAGRYVSSNEWLDGEYLVYLCTKGTQQ